MAINRFNNNDNNSSDDNLKDPLAEEFGPDPDLIEIQKTLTCPELKGIFHIGDNDTYISRNGIIKRVEYYIQWYTIQKMKEDFLGREKFDKLLSHLNWFKKEVESWKIPRKD